MKNYRIIKGKKIHVNQLAAISRKTTVKNTTKSISPVVEHERIANYVNPIVNPLTGHKFDQVNPRKISGRYGVEVTVYDWIQPDELLWEHKRYKQPKRIIKCKKRMRSKPRALPNEKWPEKQYVISERSVTREKRNDFVKFFQNYPYTIKPLTKEAYWEKLTQHKLAKWEKKNPKPVQDLFDKVEDWEQRRFVAEQHFRDFVVSCYDKLKLNGRFKTGESKYKEEKVAEIKDINMEGHHVNELEKNSKLIKKAQEITDETKKKKPNLIATNLKDHKQEKGRIILPKAA